MTTKKPATKKSETAQIYEGIAKLIQKSYEAPHGIDPLFPQFKTPHIEIINQAITGFNKDIYYLCTHRGGPHINTPFITALNTIPDLNPSIEERIKQVNDGTIEKAAATYKQLRGDVLKIGERIARILSYMRYTDQEIGIAPGIEKLLPPEYVEEYQVKDGSELCSDCGAPLTARDRELSARYCPEHGHVCEICRLNYLNEFRTSYIREHEIKQEKLKQERESAKA